MVAKKASTEKKKARTNRSRKSADASARERVVRQTYEASVNVDSLSEHPRNPNKGNVDAIRESIEANDFYGAVYAQRSTRRVLVGNHRMRAARAEGIESIPVIWLDVDDARAEKIALVDNRSRHAAETDEALLAEVLQSLVADGAGLAGTGYDDAFLAELLAQPEVEDDGKGPRNIMRAPSVHFEFSTEALRDEAKAFIAAATSATGGLAGDSLVKVLRAHKERTDAPSVPIERCPRCAYSRKTEPARV